VVDVQSAWRDEVVGRNQVVADAEGQSPDQREGYGEGKQQPQRRFAPVVDVALVEPRNPVREVVFGSAFRSRRGPLSIRESAIP
jgi:hypothetical protein